MTPKAIAAVAPNGSNLGAVEEEEMEVESLQSSSAIPMPPAKRVATVPSTLIANPSVPSSVSGTAIRSDYIPKAAQATATTTLKVEICPICSTGCTQNTNR